MEQEYIVNNNVPDIYISRDLRCDKVRIYVSVGIVSFFFVLRFYFYNCSYWLPKAYVISSCLVRDTILLLMTLLEVLSL